MTTNHSEAPQAQPRKRSLFARIFRFPLKLILLIVFGLIMGIRRHPRVSVGLVALLLVAGGAIYYFTPAVVPTTAVATSSSTTGGLSSVQGLLPSPGAPVQFLHAQQAGDANTMWGLLSDSFKQGTSLQQLQAQLQQMQPRMGAIQHIAYVGGTKEADGNGVYLYLLTVDQSGQTDQVTYLFTLDPQGKIVKIE